jgi:hypothetical protein
MDWASRIRFSLSIIPDNDLSVLFSISAVLNAVLQIPLKIKIAASVNNETVRKPCAGVIGIHEDSLDHETN